MMLMRFARWGRGAALESSMHTRAWVQARRAQDPPGAAAPGRRPAWSHAHQRTAAACPRLTRARRRDAPTPLVVAALTLAPRSPACPLTPPWQPGRGDHP